MTGANDRPMRDLVGGPVTRTARIPCPALYFVRHGQSTWNLERRVQGQQDEPELTELGRQEAADAAARLLGAARIALPRPRTSWVRSCAVCHSVAKR